MAIRCYSVNITNATFLASLLVFNQVFQPENNMNPGQVCCCCHKYSLVCSLYRKTGIQADSVLNISYYKTLNKTHYSSKNWSQRFIWTKRKQYPITYCNKVSKKMLKIRRFLKTTLYNQDKKSDKLILGLFKFKF